MPDQSTTDTIATNCGLVETMLRAHGVTVYHEWQDYLNHCLGDGTDLTFGTVNGSWECQHYWDDGYAGDQARCLTEQLPLTANPDEIVDWVKRCIAHWNKAQ